MPRSKRIVARSALRLKLGAKAVLTAGVIAACASDPWTTPPGTPDDVVQICRESAVVPPIARSRHTETVLEMPGSADDSLSDAKLARHDGEDARFAAEMMYYQCLEQHGIALDSEQRTDLHRWRSDRP